jgi:hypothetical protein
LAIHFRTADPDALLAAIYAAIDKGKLRTWQYDRDGDFTHSVPQWRNKAWLHPVKRSGELLLRIMPPRDVNISVGTYAVYHGRFVEAVLAHADKLFTEAVASAMPESGDRIKSASA